MKLRVVWLVSVVMAGAAAGCGSSTTPEVASVSGTAASSGSAVAARTPESAVREWVQCMRSQGIPYGDPVVGANGAVDLPPAPAGMDLSAAGAAFGACRSKLDGVTIGEPKASSGELLAQNERVAVCLRDRGFQVSDPTSANLDRWIGELKDAFQGGDPARRAALDECARRAASPAAGGK